MTRLPIIEEAVHVLSFIAYYLLRLRLFPFRVPLLSPFICFMTLAFHLFVQSLKALSFGLNHINMSTRFISEKAFLLKLNMLCNIVKSLDVLIVSKAYAQVLDMCIYI